MKIPWVPLLGFFLWMLFLFIGLYYQSASRGDSSSSIHWAIWLGGLGLLDGCIAVYLEFSSLPAEEKQRWRSRYLSLNKSSAAFDNRKQERENAALYRWYVNNNNIPPVEDVRRVVGTSSTVNHSNSTVLTKSNTTGTTPKSNSNSMTVNCNNTQIASNAARTPNSKSSKNRPYSSDSKKYFSRGKTGRSTAQTKGSSISTNSNRETNNVNLSDVDIDINDNIKAVRNSRGATVTTIQEELTSDNDNSQSNSELNLSGQSDSSKE